MAVPGGFLCNRLKKIPGKHPHDHDVRSLCLHDQLLALVIFSALLAKRRLPMNNFSGEWSVKSTCFLFLQEVERE